MLVKEPIERITSSDVVNLLEKENDRVVTKTFPQLSSNIHKSFLLEFIPDVRLDFKRKFKFGRF